MEACAPDSDQGANRGHARIATAGLMKPTADDGSVSVFQRQPSEGAAPRFSAAAKRISEQRTAATPDLGQAARALLHDFVCCTGR
jgi:hypothetical protein